MTKPRRNPVRLAPQPSLFADEPDFGGLISRWQDATANQLLHAAENGELTEEEFDEISEAADLAYDDGVDALIERGINHALAQALTDEFYEELIDANDAVIERRAKPLIDYIKGDIEGRREYAATEEAAESFLDWFQSERLNNDSTLLNYARRLLSENRRTYAEHEQTLEEAGYEIEDVLAEVLADPALYRLEVDVSPYGALESWEENDGEADFSARWDSGFREAVAHLRSEADLDRVEEELKRDDIYLSRYSKRNVTVADLQSEKYMQVSYSLSVTYTLSFDEAAIEEAFLQKLNEMDLGDGDESGDGEQVEDNVVYRFCGTNDCIGGASARNMYVVSLQPKQLRAEGSALILCVGNPAMPYGRDLRAGRIEIFSIRTESGRPKFTIDRDVASGEIGQIKGKLNRLPGYEPHKYNLSKPDEVRLVVEFLVSLGLSADDIRGIPDIAPGVQAMIDAGNDPFSPPPTRRRQIEEVRANSERAQRMAMAAYNRPWGGVWGE